MEPVFPEESELRTETMAGSFPSDSLGLGLASIGSPGDFGGLGDVVVEGEDDGYIVIMVIMVEVTSRMLSRSMAMNVQTSQLETM